MPFLRHASDDRSAQQGKAEALIDVVAVHRGPLQSAGRDGDREGHECLELIHRNLPVPVGVRLLGAERLKYLVREKTRRR
jgi:hypothetical protein